MNAYYIEDTIYPNQVFLKGHFDGLAVLVPKDTAEDLLAALDAKASRKDEATKMAVEVARVQGFEQGFEQGRAFGRGEIRKQIEAMASHERERDEARQ